SMKRVLAVVLCVTFLTGCTGSFALTKKVYDFHRHQESKWADELVFLGCVVLPVYSLAMVGDAIIFNTAEFWSGKNPINEANGKTLSNGDLQVLLSYSAKDDTVKVESMKSLKPGAKFVLKRNQTGGVSALDENGKVLFTSMTEADGGISVFDGNKILVRHFSPREIQEVTSKFKQQS
ncbi:MAG: DUF3332 family protein, partial [Deltaproteobacteria bacterium]